MVFAAQDTASVFFAEPVPIIERSLRDFQHAEKLIGLEKHLDESLDAISELKLSMVPTSGIPAGDKDDQEQEDKAVWKAVKISQDPSVRPLLTDRVKAALDYLLPITTEAARVRFIPVKGVELRGYIDREEESEQVIVRILTGVNRETAYKFWQYLGAKIQISISNAPAIIQDIAIERISFEVEPIEDATTV